MIGPAVAVVAGAGLGTLVAGAYYPNATLFGPAIGRGPTDTRDLYLTFDDGPSRKATAAILETLAAENVPAAFFMVGRFARRDPALTRAVAAARHEVGNHTDDHLKLHLRGPRRVRQQLTGAHLTLAELVGPPRAFRAPHGYRNPFVDRAARELGYRVFGWTFGVFDSARPGVEVIRQRVRALLRPGAIILLHDGDGYDPDGDRRQTAEALPGIIRDAQDAGYGFRPLGDLMG